MARLKVTTDADESMPLDQVPEDVRARVVEKKVWRLRSLFETDLRKAFEYLDDLRTHEAWKALGVPSFDMLCTTQLRLSADEVDAVLKARKGQSLGMVLGKPGQYGRGRPKPATDSVGDSKSNGTTNEYLAARLRRDHPDAVFYESVRGSVRQAAIAAGIVKVPSVLDQLRKLWAKASEADRRAFMEEIAYGRSGFLESLQ